MKDGQLFRVKFIKDESDLPKKGLFWVHQKTYTDSLINKHDVGMPHRKLWIKHIDWYLQPDETTDADIEAWAEKKEDEEIEPEVNSEFTLIRYKDYKNGLYLGAKAFKNGKIPHIEK